MTYLDSRLHRISEMPDPAHAADCCCGEFLAEPQSLVEREAPAYRALIALILLAVAAMALVCGLLKWWLS